jgi:hypothetical protein
MNWYHCESTKRLGVLNLQYSFLQCIFLFIVFALKTLSYRQVSLARERLDQAYVISMKGPRHAVRITLTGVLQEIAFKTNLCYT